MKFFVDNHITSIAHRGYSGKYPDNSYRSFRAAYDRNFNMIEVDIQACKTGELIIYHDVMISGTPVSELSLKEILKKKRGILTLKNFFDSFPYKSKELYFDLKGGIKTAYHLFAFLRTWNIDVSNMIAFSFNQKHLDCGYLTHPKSNYMYRIAGKGKQIYRAQILRRRHDTQRESERRLVRN